MSVVGVKHIVAIASGKGGVGKSTTAVNIALALQKQGLRVGLLDADIYGPSQPKLLGIPAGQKPDTVDEKFFVPVEAYGLQVMSMGFLVDESTPMVWRGPMIASALTQMLTQTRWNQLDCLIIDMPPGTGDIQLTLAQKFKISGAVIVTTPQDIALLDVKKALEMFQKMNVKCLGVVENMAMHTCSKCGHEEAIFGEAGGEQLAADYGVELLGRLPLLLALREQSDAGEPLVQAQPDNAASKTYLEIAKKLASVLQNLDVKTTNADGELIAKQ